MIGGTMIPYERQKKILELLEGTELLRLDEIQAAIPDASESTLRRDIRDLENNGKLVRLSGGAVKKTEADAETPVSVKSKQFATEKQVIARLAAEHVQTGDTIYIDSGSTCTELFKLVCGMKITIVTTNTDLFALTPADCASTIYVLGGMFNPSTSSIYGTLTDEAIARFVFDKAFLGANGIDAKFGVTTHTMVEATKKQLVAAHAKETYVLADSSKFGEVFATRVMPLSDAELVSDTYDETIAAATRIIAPE
jgi:DeoR family fructose operon transcriptional repressor